MRATIAKWFNEGGNLANNRGRYQLSKALYHAATRVCPTWSSPWYNLGFQAKYRGNWIESLEYNSRAAHLDPDDQASWWNMGIAATALRNWTEARRAWEGCGIQVDEVGGEIAIPHVTACVRADPNGSGEVLWGTRLDPARICVRNVPLPESGRRYKDILLNDGAENGTRSSHGNEYPVFDELAVWQPSSYSTFRAPLKIPSEDADTRLTEICEAFDIGIENWGTVRILCAECSRGNPGPHKCAANADQSGCSSYGFASATREALVDVLTQWSTEIAGAEFGDPTLALLAQRTIG